MFQVRGSHVPLAAIRRFATPKNIKDSYLNRLSFDESSAFQSLRQSILNAPRKRLDVLYDELPSGRLGVRNHSFSMPPLEGALVGRFLQAAKSESLGCYSEAKELKHEVIDTPKSLGMQSILQGDLKNLGPVGELIGSACLSSHEAGQLGSPSEQLLFLLMGCSNQTWSTNLDKPSSDFEGYLRDGLHLIAQLPVLAFLCARSDQGMAGDQGIALSQRDWAARLAGALGGHDSSHRNVMRTIATVWIRLSSYETLHTFEYLHINKGPVPLTVRKRYLFAFLRLAFQSHESKSKSGVMLTRPHAIQAIARFRSDLKALGYTQDAENDLSTTSALEDVCREVMTKAGFSTTPGTIDLGLNILKTIPFICDITGIALAQCDAQSRPWDGDITSGSWGGGLTGNDLIFPPTS